jgi:hypothetical protein
MWHVRMCWSARLECVSILGERETTTKAPPFLCSLLPLSTRHPGAPATGKRPRGGQHMGHPTHLMSARRNPEVRRSLEKPSSVGTCMPSGSKNAHSCIPESVKWFSCRPFSPGSPATRRRGSGHAVCSVLWPRFAECVHASPGRPCRLPRALSCGHLPGRSAWTTPLVLA